MAWFVHGAGQESSKAGVLNTSIAIYRSIAKLVLVDRMTFTPQSIRKVS